MNRKKLPTVKAILDYWESAVYETKKETLSFCFDREEPTCFACHDGHNGKYDCKGIKGWTDARLQRAHIIPDSLNGSNDPSNFVMLCKSCHKQNPHVKNREVYIRWMNTFHSTQTQLVVSYMNSILDSKQLKDLSKLIKSPRQMTKFIKWSSENTGSHAFVGTKTKMESAQDFINSFMAYKDY